MDLLKQIVLFPESPDPVVSLDFVLGNIRTRGKTKLAGFPIKGPDIKVFCYISRLSLQQQQKNTLKCSESKQATWYL